MCVLGKLLLLVPSRPGSSRHRARKHSSKLLLALFSEVEVVSRSKYREVVLFLRGSGSERRNDVSKTQAVPATPELRVRDTPICQVEHFSVVGMVSRAIGPEPNGRYK